MGHWAQRLHHEVSKADLFASDLWNGRGNPLTDIPSLGIFEAGSHVVKAGLNLAI